MKVFPVMFNIAVAQILLGIGQGSKAILLNTAPI
jgi:hypothetical protein